MSLSKPRRGFVLLLVTAVSATAMSAALWAHNPPQSGNVPPPLVNKVSAAVDDDSARLQGSFKDIHLNPELAFMETRTASIVAKEIKALGYEVKTAIGETGVVGILQNGSGPVVMSSASTSPLPMRTALPRSSSPSQ